MTPMSLVQRISQGNLSVSEVSEMVSSIAEDETIARSSVKTEITYQNELITAFDMDSRFLDTFLSVEDEQVSHVLFAMSDFGVQITAKVEDQEIYVRWTVIVTMFVSEEQEILSS